LQGPITEIWVATVNNKLDKEAGAARVDAEGKWIEE
jgi:hypothetical protein